MKTVLKFLTLGLILVAFGAISVTSTFAQATPEECTAIYDKFLLKRKGPDIAGFEAALALGKEYLEKCKDLDQPEVKAYIEKQIPIIETKLKPLYDDRDLYQPFNASVPAKDWDKAFNLGKQIIAKNPDFLDVILVLASIGFDTAAANNDKFNADTLNMAKIALQKMNEGKPSDSGNYGAFSYVYKTKNCTDGKTNAIGWMNYTIGYIHFYRLKTVKDATPYLYKATQVGCETKNMGDIYRMIGSWYIEEFKRLDAERIKKLELNKNEDNDETKAMFALQKGYMERIVDAYARASKTATDAKLKDSWLTRAKDFYGFRFNKDMSGFDSWVAGLNAKPFPDPASTVIPVVEATPTTTTTGATTITNDSTTSPTIDTRPRTATTTKPTTTPTTTTPATTTTKKPPAKKPAPKKKGTR